MADAKTGRVVSQDDWKRTQIRMPQEQYEAILEYAQDKDISLNTAMIELIDKGITFDGRGNPPANIRIYNLENGIKRVIFGKLVNSFDINYQNPNLVELQSDIEYCLRILKNSKELKNRLMFFNRNVLVYKGSHHIDVVDDGVGSLNWLIIEDHLTEEYMKNLHSDFESNNKDL